MYIVSLEVLISKHDFNSELKVFLKLNFLGEISSN